MDKAFAQQVWEPAFESQKADMVIGSPSTPMRYGRQAGGSPKPRGWLTWSTHQC